MKVLISAYTGLGNFILKTPMIRKIKELWPDTEIDIIAGNNFGTEFVLEGANLVHETHILKVDAPIIKKLSFFLSLRKKEYNVIFLPFDAAPKFLILGTLLMGGIKYGHIKLNPNKGTKQKLRDLFYFFALPGFRFVPLLQGRHETDLNYDLLEAFYDRPMERSYQTLVARKDNPALLKSFHLEAGQYIVIQPSAANGGLTAKVWAPRNFETLVHRINQLYPALKVVFVGDQGDSDSIRKTSLLEIRGIMNTMGKTTIADLSTILNNAAVVIAHDSGIMHIANALQVKLIALFGPTDYTCTRPLGKESHILYSKNECLAAHYNGKIGESNLARKYPDNKCMEGIRVEDVTEKLAELLALPSKRNSLP